MKLLPTKQPNQIPNLVHSHLQSWLVVQTPLTTAKFNTFRETVIKFRDPDITCLQTCNVFSEVPKKQTLRKWWVYNWFTKEAFSGEMTRSTGSKIRKKSKPSKVQFQVRLWLSLIPQGVSECKLYPFPRPKHQILTSQWYWLPRGKHKIPDTFCSWST